MTAALILKGKAIPPNGQLGYLVGLETVLRCLASKGALLDLLRFRRSNFRKYLRPAGPVLY